MVIGLETWGVFGTTVSNAGVLVSVTILAVPFVERAFGSQRIPRASFLRAGLASGAILLLAGGAITGFTTGDVLIVLSALVRAVQLVLFSKVGNTQGTSSLHISAIQMLTVAAVAGVFGGAYNLPSTLEKLEPGDWARLTYLGVGATAIAFGLQLWASRQIAPSSVALLLAGEPLVASLFAAASGQPFEGVQYIGAAMLFATVIWGTAASFSGERIGPKPDISPKNSAKQPPD
ncbi:drug/metabolite transporter (DMT)-like permease [Mycetocola sp. BIGb0189]|uniref:DMT family transporter n=1 Tax=Mycetocola sp. BIGb0189 TaxID=2940604 RepID=UPI00216828F5|nr:EamA family transporter [Mycetocola sp. BIGb0189]MCS4277080.1 drug/metabolite transporter (DMT)-like permease [Mycetocola sp. BIGb0189]